MTLNMNVEKNETAVVVSLAGRLDETTTAQLRAECTTWILKGEKAIVLDFNAVVATSSVGIHAILMAGKQLELAGGSLVLCGFQGQVKRTFQFSGLASTFQTFETLDEWKTSLSYPVPAPVPVETSKPWEWATLTQTAADAEQVEVVRPQAAATASDENSIGHWLVQAFVNPVACLDFCASWLRGSSSLELTPSKR